MKLIPITDLPFDDVVNSFNEARASLPQDEDFMVEAGPMRWRLSSYASMAAMVHHVILDSLVGNLNGPFLVFHEHSSTGAIH